MKMSLESKICVGISGLGLIASLAHGSHALHTINRSRVSESREVTEKLTEIAILDGKMETIGKILGDKVYSWNDIASMDTLPDHGIRTFKHFQNEALFYRNKLFTMNQERDSLLGLPEINTVIDKNNKTRKSTNRSIFYTFSYLTLSLFSLGYLSIRQMRLKN